ncbi:MAG TPA: DNA replication and repair protein RecF [Candidatus Peribacteraceae bacterium]|nr:DNA replication and repair protein RecF [Candidatus Peribacteraceae bacterium]
MRLLRLELEHFRNYHSQTVEFSDAPLQLFIGENGSGKTNLLEAVSLLSLTKSCRGKDEQDMVEWNDAFYRVRGVVRSDAGEEKTLEVVSEISPRKRKAMFVNNVRTPAGAFVGTLPTVTFLPQDLLLFSGTPGERRRFLDQLLSQVSPSYLEHLSLYQKILQQRNALLKRVAAGNDDPAVIGVWDIELALPASHVTLARLELIEMLNLSLLEEIRGLGESWSNAQLVYERKTQSRTQQELEQEMIDLLAAVRSRDIILQSTSVGPHREDWQMYRDGRSIPSFASRGQERVAVLALLLLEVSYLHLRRNERPVVLLDDAFSELDDAHRSALLNAFADSQVILTGTHLPPRMEGTAVYQVTPGKIES